MKEVAEAAHKGKVSDIMDFWSSTELSFGFSLICHLTAVRMLWHWHGGSHRSHCINRLEGQLQDRYPNHVQQRVGLEEVLRRDC